MRLIDMHCDTIMKLMSEGVTLHSDSCEVNLSGLKNAGSLAQFFACYVDIGKEESWDTAYATALKMADRMKREMKDNPQDLALAVNCQQIMENDRENKISAILTVEEGGILNGELERLDELYAKGIRLITLTWNYENTLAYPNSTDPKIMNCGLKPFGIETVRRMNELGMIVDVSHLSDGGFWDVMKYSKCPVVASHSCVRELCSHTRNLTHEMLKSIGENGGAVGINFFGGFLNQDGISTAKRMAEHLRYIINTAGVDAAAIGTDFDGIFGELEIDGIGKMPILYDTLRKEGFTEDEIEKICYRNVLRVIKENTRM